MTQVEGNKIFTLDDDLSHQSLLPPGSSYMELLDFVCLAEAGDYDIMFISVLYREGGGRAGIWGVDNDTGMVQTTVIVAPKSQRGVVCDNDFISNRCFGTDWRGDTRIIKTQDQVVWENQGVQHICRAPHWQIKGNHNGVEFDLTAKAKGNPTYWKGRWDELATKGGAGIGQPLWINGTIRIEGKTYQIENALGCRDNIAHTADIVEIYHKQKLCYYWLWVLDPAVTAMVYHVPGIRTHTEIMTMGRDMSFDDGTTEITALEHWVDPRTGVQLPTRWHLTMQSSAGSADLHLTGGHRAFYGFLSRSGVSMHVGFLARATGTITAASGESATIVDAGSYMEWGRAIFPLGSGT